MTCPNIIGRLWCLTVLSLPQTPRLCQIHFPQYHILLLGIPGPQGSCTSQKAICWVSVLQNMSLYECKCCSLDNFVQLWKNKILRCTYSIILLKTILYSRTEGYYVSCWYYITLCVKFTCSLSSHIFTHLLAYPMIFLQIPVRARSY